MVFLKRQIPCISGCSCRFFRYLYNNCNKERKQREPSITTYPSRPNQDETKKILPRQRCLRTGRSRELRAVWTTEGRSYLTVTTTPGALTRLHPSFGPQIATKWASRCPHSLLGTAQFSPPHLRCRCRNALSIGLPSRRRSPIHQKRRPSAYQVQRSKRQAGSADLGDSS